MLIRLLLIVTPFLLASCAAPAPLAVAGAGAYEVAKYEENIRLRAAAALRDEPDLLTFSIQAIARGLEASGDYCIGPPRLGGLHGGLEGRQVGVDVGEDSENQNGGCDESP